MNQESLPTENTPEAGRAPGAFSFVLPSIMTIETAEAIVGGFKQLPFPEKTVLTLDASQVENITTPGMQLILSLQKTLESGGGSLALSGAREATVNAFTDAGLQGLLAETAAPRHQE